MSLSSTQTPQFNTRTTPFQHPKSISSTPKLLQFNSPFNSIHSSVFGEAFFGVELRGALNGRDFGVEIIVSGVELRGTLNKKPLIELLRWAIFLTLKG